MTRIEHIVEVDVPAEKAFAQWMRYDSYPQFMEGVIEVKEAAAGRLHWRAQRHNREVEWDSEITANKPGSMITWRDVGGPGNDGRVTVYEVSPAHCRVEMVMHADLNAAPERAAEAEIALIERVEADLARFKALLEHSEAQPFDASPPGQTGVEYATKTKVPTNELLTNTPGSPKVPDPKEMAASPDADGKDNRAGLDK